MTAREKTAGPAPASNPRRGGRFQFGMRGLMATMVLLCVPFAIWGGLLQAGKESGGSPRMIIFVLLCVAAPIGMMMLLAALSAAARGYRYLRPRKPADDRDEADDFASGR